MKIIVVDDEPEVAEALATALQERGYESVFFATNADDASRIVGALGGIDILLTDVVMEETDGFTLRDALVSTYPSMKVFFLTEYDLSDYEDRIAGAPVVSKPVNVDALAEVLADYQTKPSADGDAATASGEISYSTAQAASALSVPGGVVRPPKAVPVARSGSPRVVAAPKATAATPRVSAAVPTVAATAHPAVGPTVLADFTSRDAELPPDEVVGSEIGDYIIEAKIAEHALGGIYRAVQQSMQRKVRLYLLSSEGASDPGTVERFLANASVKANVRHPAVLAVFEAGERDGRYFYTCEYVPSTTLGEVLERGDLLDSTLVLRIVMTTAEVMAYFVREKILHEPLDENCLLLDEKGNPRIANIAAHSPAPTVDAPTEIVELAGWLLPLLPTTQDAAPVQDLLTTAREGGEALRSWAGLAQEAKNRMPKVRPADAYKLDARERAAVKAVEESKKRQKRTVLLSAMGSLLLLATSLAVVYFFLFREEKAKEFNEMVAVPAGDFIYQDGKSVMLPAFWIDAHEVTIGQYAKFLEWVDANPEEAAKLAHPNMPRGKSHVPQEWADQDLPTGPMPGYYTRARKYGRYKGVPLDVNSPVFGVDWFDAYAYAAWKGRRLPTEQEWEKAARGTEGFLFPWGNEKDPTRANSGADTKADPTAGGEIDGFIKWAPVDAKKDDKSPFGVYGMAGNVSEWTSTFEESERFLGEKVPVIRGGNWTNGDLATTRRLKVFMAEQADWALGFRTASDTPPKDD